MKNEKNSCTLEFQQIEIGNMPLDTLLYIFGNIIILQLQISMSSNMYFQYSWVILLSNMVFHYSYTAIHIPSTLTTNVDNYAIYHLSYTYHTCKYVSLWGRRS